MMGLEQLEQVWDHLPALEAVLRAWQEPGASYGGWHKTARAEVAYLMPLLARALARHVRALMAERGWSGNRLAQETGIPQPTIARKLRGDTAFTVDEVGQLAAAFGAPDAGELLHAVRLQGGIPPEGASSQV